MASLLRMNQAIWHSSTTHTTRLPFRESGFCYHQLWHHVGLIAWHVFHWFSLLSSVRPKAVVVAPCLVVSRDVHYRISNLLDSNPKGFESKTAIFIGYQDSKQTTRSCNVFRTRSVNYHARTFI